MGRRAERLDLTTGARYGDGKGREHEAGATSVPGQGDERQPNRGGRALLVLFSRDARLDLAGRQGQLELGASQERPLRSFRWKGDSAGQDLLSLLMLHDELQDA